METRYVKISFDEGLETKKQFLLTELNLIRIAKQIRNYKLLRKKELLKKMQLYNILKDTRAKIDILRSTFPIEEKPRIAHMREVKLHKLHNDELKDQLLDIESKLKRLEKSSI